MNALFIASLDLRDHPLKTAKKKIRAEYALALSYLVSEVVIQAEEKRYDVAQKILGSGNVSGRHLFSMGSFGFYHWYYVALDV